MRIKYIFALLFSIVLFSSSFAASNKSELVICPNPTAFKNISFDEIQKGDTSGVWTLVKNNYTDIKSRIWKFTLMIDASTKEAAIKKAKQALAHLRKWQGPEDVQHVWVCDYKSKYSMSAVATSPE